MIFHVSEFHGRRDAAQALMAAEGLDALLLTTEPEIRYFSGFLTRFWESPTRPWFLILPRRGDPVAVIPSIGRALMARGWLRDIRCWSSPDPRDDGVSLLAATLAGLLPGGGSIGVPGGAESHLRMPLSSWEALRGAFPAGRFRDDAGILRQLRMTKSSAEIALIARACAIAGRAFDRVPQIAAPGVPLSQLFRRFQMLCLEEGADWVPYLAGVAASGGYDDVISPATDRPLAAGDVLMLDTGLVHGGYFCDFDRNFSIGPASPALRAAHAALIAATREGFAAARPGARACELHAAMARVTGDGGGSGRLGHGLGMQLTEAPSLMPADETELRPGMVLTLEPLIDCGAGKILVHEEVIVITDTGAEWLSPVAEPGIREIRA